MLRPPLPPLRVRVPRRKVWITALGAPPLPALPPPPSPVCRVKEALPCSALEMGLQALLLRSRAPPPAPRHLGRGQGPQGGLPAEDPGANQRWYLSSSTEAQTSQDQFTFFGLGLLEPEWGRDRGPQTCPGPAGGALATPPRVCIHLMWQPPRRGGASARCPASLGPASAPARKHMCTQHPEVGRSGPRVHVWRWWPAHVCSTLCVGHTRVLPAPASTGHGPPKGSPPCPCTPDRYSRHPATIGPTSGTSSAEQVWARPPGAHRLLPPRLDVRPRVPPGPQLHPTSVTTQ